MDYNYPDKCNDCRFFKIKILNDGSRKFNCMLSKTAMLAQGCPNKETENYNINY